MTRRIIAATAAAVAFGAVLLPSTAAQAYPVCPVNSQCNYAWFSSAAHTNQVGGKTVDCLGRAQFWGVQTSYLVYLTQPCQTNASTG
ncbi:MAG: DUF6289 family protein [Actinomycetota bacterium]|nr:DUF6289 family protein [Actinomycetota bacterium]MDQ2955982.1 DUF6289 family protein [Actinomycetota bacterium]